MSFTKMLTGGKKKILTVGQLQKEGQESKLIDLWTLELVELDLNMDEINEYVTRFINSGDRSWKRKKRQELFLGPEGIFNVINEPTQFKEFMKEKGKKNLIFFWHDYKQRGDIQEIILAKAEAQGELLEIIHNLKIEGQEIKIEPKKIKSSTLLVERIKVDDGYKLIVVDKSSKIPTNKSQYESVRLERCINQNKDVEWLNDKVIGTYIAAPLDSYAQQISKYFFLVPGSSEIKPVMHSIKIGNEIKQILFYRSSREFYKLWCNKHSKRIYVDDKNIVRMFLNNGNQLSFYVMYKIENTDTTFKWEMLTKSLFNQKRRWEKDQKHTREERIFKLLNQPVKEVLESLTISILRSMLNRIAPTITKSLSKWEKFSKEVVIDIKSKNSTAKKFIDKYSLLTMILEEPKAKVLHDRIINGYYRPKGLANATIWDLYPEAVNNAKNMDKIQAKISRNSKNIAEMYYQILNPTERISSHDLESYQVLPNIQTSSWKEKCVNKGDIEDVPDYKIIPYDENGKIYCFNLDNILSTLKAGNTLVNKYTNNALTDDFIDMIKESFKEDDTEISTKISQGDEDIKIVNILAPGLLDIVLANIKTCQEQLKQGKNCSGLSIVGSALLSGDSSEMSPDTESESGSESESESESGSESGSESEMSSDIESDRDENSCVKCKQSITGNPNKIITTILWMNNKPEVISFCDTYCAEDTRLFKKSRKNGRNGTRERN